jgi:hypothetical protein
MAHFAKIENNIVTNIIIIPNEEEHRGQDYINNDMNIEGTWLQCSYNTYANQHINGGTPLRGNYPGVGFSYDSTKDAFIPPKPSDRPSWVLDENMLIWTAPVSIPDNEQPWHWDEEQVNWILL